ncbi:MAG: hypothetical protein IKO03_09335 [Lachnospiraceae bacterium]|nr:hypothetical protein [Lachnospiraceae bacterium]
MTQFFQEYFHFALEATVIVCIVLAVRPLFRRYSKRIANLLWVAVFFRLLCPYTAEGPIPAFWENWTAEGQIEQAADMTAVEGKDVFHGEDGTLLTAMDGRGMAEQQDPSGSQEAFEGQKALESQEAPGSKDAQASLEPNDLQDAQASQNVQGPQGVQALQNVQSAQGSQVSKETWNPQGIQDGEELLDSQENPGSQGALYHQNTPETQTAQGIQNARDTESAYGDQKAQNMESAYGDQTAQDVQNAWEIQNSQGSESAMEPQDMLHSEGKEFSLRSSYAVAALWFQSVAGKCFLNVCGVIWAFGAGLFLLYGIGLYVRLSKKLEEAIPMGAWGKYPIKSSDVSGVPMSFGVFRRGIYVPFYFQEQDGALKKISSKEKELILHHEAMHLSRLDPLWKLISYLALCLHWWNPVAWLCVRCFHKDLEMACDEGVLSKIGQENRGDYAKALLHFAQRRSGLSLSAAFGESNAESRIKEVLKFRKMPLWMTISMTVLVVLLGGCLATRPATGTEEKTDEKTNEKVAESAAASQTEKEPDKDAQTSGIITEITSLEQAIPSYLRFRDVKGQRTAPVNVPYFGYDEGWYDVYYLDELTQNWKTEEPEKYQALLDPVTALETLLPLKGGSGKAYQESFSSVIVEYTFANGETAHYSMARRGEAWYPYQLMEELLADPLLTEDSRKTLLAKLDRIEKQKEELAETTAEQLRGVTLQVEDVEYGRNRQEMQEYNTENIYACWNHEKLGKYCILGEIPEADACLYGLYDGCAMMLRVGDQAYPIHGYWTNIRSDIPQMYCGDYDHDGQKEFALITLGKTGTGTFGNWLRVIEVTEDGLEIHEPKSQGMYGQLEQKITYQYDEKTLMLRVETKDGDVAFASLEDIPLLASGEEQFLWLSYGQTESFSVMDDYLFYDVSSGIQLTNKGDVEYGGIDLDCQIQYHEDGSFSIGNIQLEKAWPGPINQIDLSEGFAGEEVILTHQVELTHDDVPDWIVTSVTYQEENKATSWENRMMQGDVCIVRVYDGARQAESWKKGSVPEGTFDKENIIWEQALANAQTGNGIISLCEREGKHYLLLSNHGMWQGIMNPTYQVIALDTLGGENIIDTANVAADINSLEGAFSVEDLMTYTEKLNGWMKDGQLIAMTDLTQGNRISSGTLGQSTYKGKTIAVAFEAWEIWNELADCVNSEIAFAQTSSISPINVTQKYVPCTGMDNLRESLTSLRKRFEVYMEWQQRMSQASSYSVDLQDGRNVITCDITHDGYLDSITVDYAAIEEDNQAFLTIDARDEHGLFLWEAMLALPHVGWGKYYVTMYQRMPYLVYYVPLEATQGTMYGYYKVFWLNQKGEEQILEERTINSETAKDYEKEAAEFQEAINSYLGTRSELLASTWDGELTIRKKPANW